MTAFYIFCTCFALYAIISIINDDLYYEKTKWQFMHTIILLIAFVPVINIPIAIAGFVILISGQLNG